MENVKMNGWVKMPKTAEMFVTKHLIFLTSYDSWVACVDTKNKIVYFGPDFDYSMTTKKHCARFFSNLGIDELSTPSQRRKAIEDGTSGEWACGGITWMQQLWFKVLEGGRGL